MKKSAKRLGEEFNLTAQEMNHLLKEEGFLSGEPGDYSPTEKAKEYLKEDHYHRGTGGYSHYNRYWTERNWDESIMDNIEIDADRKREIREAVSLERKVRKEARQKEEREKERHYYERENEQAISVESRDEEDKGSVLPVVLLVAAVAAGYGIHKVSPYVKKWWNETAFPKMKETWGSIRGKETNVGRNEINEENEGLEEGE